MKKIIFLISCVACINSGFAQSQSDSILLKGGVFVHQGKRLTPKQLMLTTQSNPAAYKEMKIAKTNNDIGTVFGFAGGFLIGWPVGTAIGGGQPKWAIAGLGAGLVAFSIPFSIAYKKQAKKAVAIFNSELNNVSTRTIELKFHYAYNGLGLRVNF